MEQKLRIPVFVCGIIGVIIIYLFLFNCHCIPQPDLFSIFFGGSWFFFIGATIGFVFLSLVKKEWASLKKPPLWVVLSVIAYVLSIASLVAAGNHNKLPVLLFPILWGDLLVPGLLFFIAAISNTVFFLLMAAFNTAFAIWAYWEFLAPFDKSEAKKIIRRAILIILFFFILNSAVACSSVIGVSLS